MHEKSYCLHDIGSKQYINSSIGMKSQQVKGALYCF